MSTSIRLVVVSQGGLEEDEAHRRTRLVEAVDEEIFIDEGVR